MSKYKYTYDVISSLISNLYQSQIIDDITIIPESPIKTRILFDDGTIYTILNSSKDEVLDVIRTCKYPIIIKPNLAYLLYKRYDNFNSRIITLDILRKAAKV